MASNMSLKAPTVPKLPPPTTPERDSSPELGSPSKITQYNKQTGRPIRKSAGKVKRVAGYVDSRVLEEEEFVPLTSDDSEEEDDEDDMEPRSRAKKTKAKRKRSPSPPSPRLNPIIYTQELEELTDDESGGAFHRHTPKKPPVTLQFNVPLGFHGPLFVKLDSTMLHANEDGKVHEALPKKTKRARTGGTSPTPTATRTPYKGFTDLPPELRNKIYRHVFVNKDTDLWIPCVRKDRTLSYSSQFLRTCKLVHDEACSILYGENSFFFDRHHSTRGTFWESIPKEIGYQDALHFLKMIGPENVQYLRDVKFIFDDAMPRHTTYLASNEDRRYLNDDYLVSCLRILRDAKLRKIRLEFDGRRQLCKSDVKFLGYLEQVKADEVTKLPTHFWGYHDKISHQVWLELQEAMVRKNKLYKKE